MDIFFNTNKSFFRINNINAFKSKVLAWSASTFDVLCYLENNAYTEGLVAPEFDCLIACGVDSENFETSTMPFEDLENFYEMRKDWLFGFLTYDLKNHIEKLSSQNIDHLHFPEFHFFKPSIILKIKGNELEFIKNTSKEYTNSEILDLIKNFENKPNASFSHYFKIKKRFTKKEYIQTVKAIKGHILRGDIFEMNFCQEFYIENATIDPYALFLKLNEKSKAPFSAFYKLKDKYALCASPERFLKKKNNILISQPIKGTAKRGVTEGVDVAIKEHLRNDPKCQSENVMIVDLVRNDLGKTCEAGSVKVTELFGIYTFPTVHQMISTIEGKLRKDNHFVNAIKQAFPMGSMTGAPKVRAMQLIEEYEKTKRGLYSGCIGYITPEGDFDFNVLIRSVLYNAKNRYLSFQVGGAIVFDSIPEKEYEECLIKIKAIINVLNDTII